jgi:ABC-type sugar transport system substrate-binding protein
MASMDRRRFLGLSAAALGGAALSGCDVPLVGGGADRGGLRKLVGLGLYADTPWTRLVAGGVAAELRGSGYQLLVRQAGFSAAAELANLQSFANRKASGAIVLPVGVETATRGAQTIQQKGGAVIDALSPGEGGAGDKYYAGFVQPLGEEGGHRIAEWLTREEPDGGEVVIVQGLLGQGVSEQLDRGLLPVLRGTGGRFPVVARGPGNLSPQDAVAVVRGAFERHPRARFVLDYGAEMAPAISRFLQDSRRRDVVHLSLAAEDETARWLRTPYLRATLYFSAAELGRAAARMLLDVLRDEDETHDPFTVEVPHRMTDDVSRPPNSAGPPPAIQAPVPESEAAPLPPTRTEAGDLG